MNKVPTFLILLFILLNLFSCKVNKELFKPDEISEIIIFKKSPRPLRPYWVESICSEDSSSYLYSFFDTTNINTCLTPDDINLILKDSKAKKYGTLAKQMWLGSDSYFAGEIIMKSGEQRCFIIFIWDYIKFCIPSEKLSFSNSNEIVNNKMKKVFECLISNGHKIEVPTNKQ